MCTADREISVAQQEKARPRRQAVAPWGPAALSYRRRVQARQAYALPTPIGPTSACKSSPNRTAASGMRREPPDADPHVRWRGGRRREPGAYPITIRREAGHRRPRLRCRFGPAGTPSGSHVFMAGSATNRQPRVVAYGDAGRLDSRESHRTVRRPVDRVLPWQCLSHCDHKGDVGDWSPRSPSRADQALRPPTIVMPVASGLDDVRFVGDPDDDRFRTPGVGDTGSIRRPQVCPDNQGAMFALL